MYNCTRQYVICQQATDRLGCSVLSLHTMQRLRPAMRENRMYYKKTHDSQEFSIMHTPYMIHTSRVVTLTSLYNIKDNLNLKLWQTVFRNLLEKYKLEHTQMQHFITKTISIPFHKVVQDKFVAEYSSKTSTYHFCMHCFSRIIRFQ